MERIINIEILLQYLKANHWHITAFYFRYEGKEYIVLFEDIENLPLAEGEYPVYLTFIDKNDEDRILQVKANRIGFKIGAKELREYFGIPYSDHLGDALNQLYDNFNNAVPEVANQIFDEETKRAVINRLSYNDGQDKNNICCYAAKRNGIYNGKQHRRTPFNSDKTKLLRESLFNMLGDDDTISFCYRADNELSDVEIYNNFAKKYGIK